MTSHDPSDLDALKDVDALGRAMAIVQDARGAARPLPARRQSPKRGFPAPALFVAGIVVGSVATAVLLTASSWTPSPAAPPPPPQPVVVASSPPPPPVALPPVVSPCAWTADIPAGTQVYATGADSGRELDFSIDDSGPASRFDVVVNEPGAPVLLVLAASEPSIWNITWTPGTQIVGALVSGNHRQVIAGLPPDTPTVVMAAKDGASAAGGCASFLVSPDDPSTAAQAVQALLHRNIDKLYVPTDAGHVVVGQPLRGHPPLEQDETTTVDSYRDPSRPRAGELGLQDALQRGELRLARPSDAQAWARAAAQHDGGRRGARLRAPNLSHRDAYVVLKPFVYPSGLHGAHSAVFFVAAGVPLPTGNRGHSTVYDMNTATCQGIRCGAGDD